MIKLFFVAAGLSLLAVPAAHSSLLLSDIFAYPDGSVISVSAGAWLHHSGASNEVTVESGRLRLSEANTEDVSIQLAGQPYPASTNVILYASFTINVTSPPAGASGYFAHFKSSGTSGFGGRACLTTNGAPLGTFRVGVANSTLTPSAVINSNLTLNTDYSIIIRYAPSNGVCNLWLNPQSESDPSITATDATFSVATFAFREADGIGDLFVDNLLVGTTFNDVFAPLAPTSPQITVQPNDQTVTATSNANFSVSATGTQPLLYQWQFYGTNLPGETSLNLVLTNVSAVQAGPYNVLITNSAGWTSSRIATLTVNPYIVPPSVNTQPQSQIVAEGNPVIFTVSADGDAPLSYQWRFNNSNLAGATASALNLGPAATNDAGSYAVVITNSGGSITSQPAILTVNSTNGAGSVSFSMMTYNLKGNGATNWSTNATQVQAIGRQLMYLQPDVITFNEVPNSYMYEMTNWITAFLPGYNLATNSGTDGFIRSAIASRFPITRSQKWLDGVSLASFGYPGNFTRDLFEAQIAVPGFPQPLHVFVTHLKATTSSPTNDAIKRGAEASAISNFLVTAYLSTNALHPYILAGDLNEDVFRPETNNYVSAQPIQRLVSTPTGLMLTTPLNPITHTDLTESIQGKLNVRFDYILPSGLLYSNILSSQVFRTDLLTNPPPPLQTNDDRIASDHLPVLMVFSNPYNQPFTLTSITQTNQNVTLQWQSVPGQPYRVESSSNLTSWSVFSTAITATASSTTFATNAPGGARFFRIYRFP